MARTTVPLTNTQVKQAKAKQAEYSLADGDGLSLRIRPNGSKSWFFNYVVPVSKKRFKISFGQYPEVSLADARRKRAEARALVAAGVDPKVHSQQMRKEAELEYSQTLQVVAKRWFKRWKQRKRIDELTASKAWRLLELHVFPKLGALPMSDISAPIVIDALSPLEKSNHLESLQKARTKLNQIATYAVNTGVIHSNPLSGLAEAFKANHGTHNPSIDIQELPSLIRNVMQSSSTVIIKSAFMWQLMTCVRPAEAAGARWEEIDLERQQWLIPANRMKGGLHEHIVPLTPEMLTLLELMKPISGHYVASPVIQNGDLQTNTTRRMDNF